MLLVKSVIMLMLRVSKTSPSSAIRLALCGPGMLALSTGASGSPWMKALLDAILMEALEKQRVELREAAWRDRMAGRNAWAARRAGILTAVFMC